MFGVQAWVGPQSTLRRYWGHMLKIHGTAPHSRHTSPSSLRRGRGVLSLRARTVEKAPLPSTKVGSASGAGSTRPEGYAPWLGHVASPACPRARTQPSLARCTRESALSSQEVCGSARLGGGGSATLSGAHRRIGWQMASGGGGEWRRLPGESSSRSTRAFAVKRDSRARKRTASRQRRRTHQRTSL